MAARAAVAIGSAQVGRDLIVTLGLASKASSYAELIRRFIRFYGGTLGHCRPFAGRQAEIGRLNAWLADLGDAPNMLLTAPAGRGKSMLLVQWLAQLSDSDLDVVFIPISQRYETNRAAVFLEALAARLAELLPESLPPPC